MAPVSAQPTPSQMVEQLPKAEEPRATRTRQNRPNSATPIRAAKKAAPKPVESKPVAVPPAAIADLRPADRAEAKPVANEKIKDLPPMAGTTPEQVATAPATENPTTARAGPAPEQKADSNTKPSPPANVLPQAAAETTALASPNSAPPTDAAQTAPPKPIDMPPAKTAELHPADRGEAKSAPAEKITDSPPISNPTSGSDAGTPPEQVATATSGPSPEQKVESNTKPAGPAEAIPSAGAETSALAPPNGVDQLVAILLVRPEIKSVSDLANKIVAIDASQSESVASVRSAIAAAGAADVQVNAGEALALTRVIDGEVRAAVVSLTSPEEAEMWSAGMPGFKILRIPLSRPSEKARRG